MKPIQIPCIHIKLDLSNGVGSIDDTTVDGIYGSYGEIALLIASTSDAIAQTSYKQSYENNIKAYEPFGISKLEYEFREQINLLQRINEDTVDGKKLQPFKTKMMDEGVIRDDNAFVHIRHGRPSIKQTIRDLIDPATRGEVVDRVLATQLHRLGL